MKRFFPIITTAIAFLLVFGGVSHAAAAMEPSDGSLLDLLRPVLDAFQHGQTMYAGSLALVLAVAVARRYGTSRYPWLATDEGAGALTLVGSFGASMAASWAGGVEVSWLVAWHSLEIAFGAAGGYAIVKTLIIKVYVRYLANKGPEWVHFLAPFILPIFQASRTPPTPEAQAMAGVKAIDRPDTAVVVSVTSAMGSAVATSPAEAPASEVTVESGVSVARVPTGDKPAK